MVLCAVVATEPALHGGTGIAERTSHDIRRTALTELGNRGATNAEIVRFSGHDINSRVLKTYVKPDRTAAENAAKKRWGME